MANVFEDSFATAQSQTTVGDNTVGPVPPLSGTYPNSDMTRRFAVSVTGASVVADGAGTLQFVELSGTVEYKRPGFVPFSMGAATQFVLSGVTVAPAGVLVLNANDGSKSTSSNVFGPKTNETVTFNFATDFPGIDFASLVKIDLGQLASGGSATVAVLAADPHVLCLDGTRLDVYAPGFYRFYDNGADDPDKRLVANIEVRQNERMQDYASAVWIRNGAEEPAVHAFEGRVFDSLIDGQHNRVSVSIDDKYTGATMEFILEGVHNTLATKCKNMPPAVIAGGLMSGQIQRIGSLDSEERVGHRLVMACLGATASHALVCGSGSPHAVSFHGERVETDLVEATTLYDDGSVVASAMFVQRRIESLIITRDGRVTFEAKWDPSIIDQENGWVDVSVMEQPCNRIRGAHMMSERVVGNLFVRVQPGGVASFSVFGKLKTEEITGILTTPIVVSNVAGIDESKFGIYAKVMEPHLLHVC